MSTVSDYLERITAKENHEAKTSPLKGAPLYVFGFDYAEQKKWQDREEKLASEGIATDCGAVAAEMMLEINTSIDALCHQTKEPPYPQSVRDFHRYGMQAEVSAGYELVRRKLGHPFRFVDPVKRKGQHSFSFAPLDVPGVAVNPLGGADRLVAHLSGDTFNLDQLRYVQDLAAQCRQQVRRSLEVMSEDAVVLNLIAEACGDEVALTQVVTNLRGNILERLASFKEAFDQGHVSSAATSILLPNELQDVDELEPLSDVIHQNGKSAIVKVSSDASRGRLMKAEIHHLAEAAYFDVNRYKLDKSYGRTGRLKAAGMSTAELITAIPAVAACGAVFLVNEILKAVKGPEADFLRGVLKPHRYDDRGEVLMSS